MAETIEQRIHTLEKLLSSQPLSPLFAQLAGYYLDVGRSQDALKLCDSGLALYPFYTTGHLIKGKILLALNMRSEARREFEFVHQMLPLNETVERLVADLPPSSEESLDGTAPPAEPLTEPSPPPKVEAQPAVEEPVSPESSSDQWMSQFTEEPAPSEGESKAEASPPPPQARSAPETSLEQPPAAETAEDSFGISTTEDQAGQQDVFETPAAEPQALSDEGEAFEQFAERKRGELFGLEHSMSLDDYLTDGPRESTEPPTISQSESAENEPPTGMASDEFADPFAELTQYAEPEAFSPEPPAAAPTDEDPFAPSTQEGPPTEQGPSEDPFAPSGPETPGEPKDQIEELAEKLRDAKKITPVINLSDRTPVSPSETETPAGTGFVTPTLAEIYAKQGWYDDAIKAYKTLAANRPAEKEKYDARIAELEELKKQQENG